MTATTCKLGADMTDEQIDDLWIHRPSIHDGQLMPQLRDFARAILARQPAAIGNEADDDIEEAREILENMVRSIELDGNYSTEATCTFLRQALNCLPVAAPLANEASKREVYRCGYDMETSCNTLDPTCKFAAPSVEQDERGAFEAEFKMPVQCTRCDDGYAVTGYEAWDASAFILRWEGWQARAAYPSANVTQWESTAIANELWQLADQCGYEQFRDALSSHIKRAYQDGWQDRTTGVASVTYGEQK